MPSRKETQQRTAARLGDHQGDVQDDDLAEMPIVAHRVRSLHEQLSQDEVHQTRFAVFLALREMQGDSDIDHADPIGAGLRGILNFITYSQRVGLLVQSTGSLTEEQVDSLDSDVNMRGWLSAFDAFQASRLVRDHEGISLLRGGSFVVQLREELEGGVSNG